MPPRAHDLRSEIDQTLAVAGTLANVSPEQALQLAGQAQMLAESIEYHAGQALALYTQAAAFSARNALVDAERMARRAQEMAEAHALWALWFDTLDLASGIAYDLEQYDVAVDGWLKQLERGFDRDEPLAILRGYLGLGKVFFMYGDLPTTTAMLEKAREYLPQITRHDVAFGLYINLAADACHHADFSAALKELASAEALLDEMGYCQYEHELYYYRGHIYRRQGKLHAALRQLERSLALNAGTSNQWGRTVNLIELGETCLDLGQLHAAQYYLNSVEEAPMLYLQMQIHGVLARVSAAVGRTDREFVHWQKHFALAERMAEAGAQPHVAKLRGKALAERMRIVENRRQA
ncbi:hypothetical protein [Chitiniphilus eburneus]|uniref:Uncharacterized protein n=1 Tax=Chitiniphilus eburneus TaxID=2571148 RepID=A0A4U0Q8V6_9NEIS|nr:hypothetical protein [Chitiniphilus eburneus]TJZ77635.1 hypothetical protein FAZ21_04750 [Chitiniphilus eburneus]